MEITDYLRRLVLELEERGIPYALCGDLAVAVHAFPRATRDIDLLVQESDLERTRAAASEVGFSLDVACPDPELDDVVPLDLIPVTPPLQEAWDSRLVVEWEHGRLSVVSREGLIRMKTLRGSEQDQADIRRLREG